MIRDAGQARTVLRAIRLKKEGNATTVHSDYQQKPIGWIVDVLGVDERTLRWSINTGYRDHKWDGTVEPLMRMADALALGGDVGVESATGAGKSFMLACLTFWFVACWPDARVFSYAPKEDQLRLFMWAEMRKLWPAFKPHFPQAELTDLRLRMIPKSDQWGAWGYAVGVGSGEQSATRAQGAHAEHMLLIVEEMPGLAPAVMTALENTSTGPHNLRICVGNPDSQHDELHRFCTSPDVEHVRISGLDHPNVVCDDADIVPGAVSLESVHKRARKYGEDSRLYRSRIRGISPAEAEDALINLEWCEEAATRYADPTFRQGVMALGVDVAASEAGDKAAIAQGKGACLLEVRSFACPDPVQLGIDVGALIQADGIDPRRVGVDSVGVGAGAVGALKQMGSYVRSLNAGTKPTGGLDSEARARTGRAVYSDEQFANLRAQMYWKLRTDLQRGHIALPDDRELFDDLTTPTWLTRNGKILVEPKEKIRERLGRSPDKGDAAVFWNWVRSRPAFKRPEKLKKRERNTDYGLERLFERHARQQRLQRRYPF